MDPEPSTSATSGRASRHRRGNIEVSEMSPNALLLNRENGEVIGLDGVHLRWRDVGDGESASLDIIQTGGMVFRCR